MADFTRNIYLWGCRRQVDLVSLREHLCPWKDKSRDRKPMKPYLSRRIQLQVPSLRWIKKAHVLPNHTQHTVQMQQETSHQLLKMADNRAAWVIVFNYFLTGRLSPGVSSAPWQHMRSHLIGRPLSSPPPHWKLIDPHQRGSWFKLDS